ncbi:MAG: hypothetical protein ACRC5W_06925 [Cetobacterium sp.]|uniref:hypothetical protein n=1 Tax=Cetobacterium sp. TaxID=2071632 RepID=UPI003F344199
MKKSLKIALGIGCTLSIMASVFYTSKENPRVYLNNRINLAYVNEEINNKKFDNVLNVLNKSEFKVDLKIEESLKYIKGIYILSDSSFISDKKTCVGIVDFGYIYPFIKFKMEKYFDKIDDMYSLKEEYKNKYTNGNSLYLKIEKGNFIIATRQKDVEKVVKSEKYLSQNILKILEKEKKSNLGMLILNLGKNPLGGFNELVLTGDVNTKNEMMLTTNIGGKNDIIESFNKIEEDGLDGERILQKNELYLRSSKDAELRSFLFFLNYFFKNSIIENISSKIKINTPKKDPTVENLSKKEVINTKFEKTQFVYGHLDFKIKEKMIGQIEIKGLAEINRLKIETILNETTIINLLKTAK